MRSKSIALIVIAVVCGTVAATGVSQAIRSPGGPVVETEKIFVASKEIDIREAFNAENIRLEEWPKEKIPPGAITKLEEIEGQYPRSRLFEGEVILTQKLMGKDEVGSHEVTIPQGYRVKSVQVSMASAVSNLVMPGSRVDVLVYLSQGEGVANSGAYTFLKNVRVYAVNEKVDRNMDEDGKVISAQTVSLLVKPDQVEKLLIASSVGHLELSLRRPDDNTDDDNEDDDMTALSELLRGGAALGVEKPVATEPARPAADNFADFLSKGGASAPAEQPPAPAPVNMPNCYVMTPEGAKQYRWKDPNQLPEEVQENFTATPAPIGPAPAGEPTAGEPAPSDAEGIAKTPPANSTEEQPN